ncbi:MAG: fasciclin domain-containing protein [Planctomycetes bacterium]|nr:fasciclin domain-containing protein [Planctomycetota bacterium]
MKIRSLLRPALPTSLALAGVVSFVAADLTAQCCGTKGKAGAAAVAADSPSTRALPDADGDTSRPDLVDTAAAAGSFKTLVAAVKSAGLVDALKGEGPFTVFAPSDEAFAKLPAGTLESLLRPENKAKLQAILTYHVVPGKVMAADVVKVTGAATLNGQRIDVATSKMGVKVDGARVVKTDIVCKNGVIHVIDQVILPAADDLVATAAQAPAFKTLVAAVKAAGLVEALEGKGPFTVLAPTNAAFAALPEGTLESLLRPENQTKLESILKFHVIPGRIYSPDAMKAGSAKTLQGGSVEFEMKDGEVYVNGAKVIRTDLDATNGVIHVIDAVILPQ